uniref:Acyltransferase n=1 Tax=Chromera velia CCMP2878 TaxID=1169474 RepID=A0A0G4F961_9ALVE|eukprot:Cvel_15735.t1-p1 / transcript=Cvel_15735.t1 / gene=Cvel_15735 / organism=Chromera_velia_CCMP2878 / gene_product=2-acylglycerol O-acyltransferase 1, putative / transcript_product=2-acylglycerol O-acyltransferase 1, putative / location=Cvel_scaffold1177:11629-13037(-) / protein_length=325 / sequence_SO=supercontig / SO=protein_coding / is_pseudo=false
MRERKPAGDGKAEPTVIFSHASRDPIMGAGCILLFVVFWTGSLLFPFWFFALIRARWLLTLAFLLAVSAIGYVGLPRNETFGKFVAKWVPRYYAKASVRCDSSLPDFSTGKTVYLCHPHGIFCDGLQLFGLCTDARKHLRFAMSEVLLWAPLFRLLFCLLAKPMGVSKASVLRTMREGHSFAIAAGGFEEATLTCLHKDRVFVSKRKGIFKYALENGYSVVPVYAFGESECFLNPQGMWGFRFWLNSLGVPAVMPAGNPWLPLLPRISPEGLHVVIGQRLSAGQIAEPKTEDIDSFHQRFVDELKKLYERHRGLVGKEGVDLEVW